MKLSSTRLFALTLVVSLSVVLPAHAQKVDQAVMTHARSIANVCLGNWETPACLTAVSQSNIALVSNYGAMLQYKNLTAQAETLKQHCAASTAHSEQAFPAYAMKSAFIECANIMTDLADQTGVKPDPDHNTLLVLPILCMSKDARCGPMEKGMAQYKTR